MRKFPGCASAAWYSMLGAALFVVWSGTASAFAVTATGSPNNAQAGVPVDAFINRDFDLALSGATLTLTNVKLQTNTGNAQGGAPTGSNLCASVRAEFANKKVVCEHIPLNTSTWYTFTLTTGIKTSTGLALAADATYAFQTSSFAGGGNFIVPPVVIGSTPRPGATIPTNGKIRVYFRPGGSGTGSSMKTSATGSVLSTANVQLFATSNGQPTGSNLLTCGTVGSDPKNPTDCNMSWNGSGSELIITPAKKSPGGTVATTGTAIAANTKYALIVKGPSGGFGGLGGVRNTDNMPLGGPDFFVLFTATGSDAVGPTVKASFPKNADIGIDRALYDMNIIFTEAADPTTVSGSSIQMYRDGGNGTFDDGADDTLLTGVTVTYSPEDGTAHVSPSSLLAASTKFFVVVRANAVKDAAGNGFDGDRGTGGNQNTVLSFTTGTNINGGASDSAGPRLTAAFGDNFSVAGTFNEPMKLNTTTNPVKRTSQNPFDVNNIGNWVLESPPGVTVNLSGKPISYDPARLTVTIGGLTLPPNQDFVLRVGTSTGVVKIQDVSGNVVDSSFKSAQGKTRSVFDTNGQVGPGQSSGEFDFFKNGVTPTMAMPASPLAGVMSNYRIEISTKKSVPSGGKITLLFPSGFSFSSSNPNCATAPTVPDNNDINGPASGTVTIASIACDGTARTVTITTGGASTGTGSRVRIMIQGVNNSPVPKDFTTAGYTVDITTLDVGGNALDRITSMPFFLNQAGSQYVRGTVFRDNGAGGGTATDSIKNGSETGVRNVQVCLGGPTGSFCKNTTNTGSYSFDSLSDGFYKVNLPPLASGSLVGNDSAMRDIQLNSGQNKANVDFALRVSTQSIVVSISGIPVNTNIDVGAFRSNSAGGAPIVKEVDYSSSTATVSLPTFAGTWQVFVGPRMNKDPSFGNTIPTFSFMPPQPQNVTVGSSGDATASFALASAGQQIKGKVYSNSGSVLPNAFIIARPVVLKDKAGSDGMGQSQSDGSFTVNVSSGAYTVQAFMPGMSPSAGVPVLVKPNSSNADNNTSADVSVNGTLITNAGSRGSTANLELVITQGGLSIAGKILDENGNGIPYSHVRAKRLTSGSFDGDFREAPTNSAGSFTLYVNPSTTYELDAFAPGYGKIGSLTVAMGTSSVTGQNIQASNADFGTITGTVTQNGTAVVGAFVNAYGSTGGNSTITGSGGTYTLKVQAGSYTVEGFVPGTGPTTRLTSVSVTAGQTTSGKNLSVKQGGTITVTISGVTDAFVRAEDSSGQGNGTNLNPTAGVYSITVASGTYTVKAHSPSIGSIGSTSVTVSGGGTATATITPPTTFTVSGTISSDSATCSNAAMIAFADINNGRMVTKVADSNGVFSLSLPNGTYRVSAGKPGCVDNASPSNITVSNANVSSAANRTLVAASLTITGKVTLNSAAATVATKVVGSTSDGRMVFSEVSSGSYTLNVTAGTWNVRARADGYVTTTTSVSAGGTANLDLSAVSGYTRRDPQSSQITPTAGGIVKNSTISSNFEVNLPAGALGTDSTASTITTSPTTNYVDETPSSKVVGQAVEITPTDADGNTISSLDSAATIKMPYTEGDLRVGAVDATGLSIATWNDSTGTWDSLATTVDTTNKILTASTSHFSTFAVVAPANSTSSGTSGTSGTSTTSGTSGGGGGGGGRRTLPGTTLKGAAPLGKGATAAPKPGARVTTPTKKTPAKKTGKPAAPKAPAAKAKVTPKATKPAAPKAPTAKTTVAPTLKLPATVKGLNIQLPKCRNRRC